MEPHVLFYVCAIYAAVKLCVASERKENYILYSSKSGEGPILQEQQPQSSVVSCARSCIRVDNCIAANYDHGNHTCTLLSHVWTFTHSASTSFLTIGGTYDPTRKSYTFLITIYIHMANRFVITSHELQNIHITDWEHCCIHMCRVLRNKIHISDHVLRLKQ